MPSSPEELEETIDGLYRVSMGAVAGLGKPESADVLRIMIDKRLIGESSRTPGKMTITGLGRAISASGVPFGDAEAVERMAGAALDGAGTMTLLWMAVNTSFVREALPDPDRIAGVAAGDVDSALAGRRRIEDLDGSDRQHLPQRRRGLRGTQPSVPGSRRP